MSTVPDSPWKLTGKLLPSRRSFLKTSSVTAAGLAFLRWPAMAGPFTRKDFERLVPADKKLRPEWVKALFERGQRTIYRGAELDKIGMPIGGICAGQLYLGGDGKLWHWDIFNQRIGTGAEHYAKPMKPTSALDQGFALRVSEAGTTRDWTLDRTHWRDVSFIGEYPIGYVEYREPDASVSVSLEAFSPFIPLNEEDSSLPATVLEFTIKNERSTAIEVELAGWLENAVCRHSSPGREGVRRNRVVKKDGLLFLECSAGEATTKPASARPDVVFDDFESETYRNWAVTGTAFGTGPVELAKIPAYQGDVGGKGKRVVNSHASAPGQSVEEKDSAVGTLTSRPFTIERDYITFLIGGGAHRDKTCMNLVVDGKVVLSATGQNENRMHPLSWSVKQWAGKSATLQIVDQEQGGWGNIGIDDIVFSDQPREPLGPLSAEGDFGTMGLGLIESKVQSPKSKVEEAEDGCAEVVEGKELGRFFAGPTGQGGDGQLATRPLGQRLVGALTRKMKLAPGASGKATFVLTWHMPNLKLGGLPGGRHYATRFASAYAVAQYVQDQFPRLSSQTRLWHDTWYDSTLPYWFLDRTFLNTSILATSTCHRFSNGRFYGWEGVGCCEGTCGHVWQYAHAMARLFPELERMTREKVDLGLAFQSDGAIHFRGECNDIPAIDAQAGTILRVLREHQMSADDAFLRRNWPHVKKAVDWLIAKDGNGDGLIEGNQHNTLDTDWFGPVAWLSGLYLAALLAARQMALELGDVEFAERCRVIFEAGQKNFVARLFEDGYFINRPDPKHTEAINSGTGCEIDQVFGQSWAFQVGLPRVFPEAETLSALKSLWRYNFIPDVGPYREVYKPGRWYAMAGEAGLLMCTFPRSDWDYAQAKGKGPDWAAGYFNECMNGFEYEVAGHMIWEGMVMEGLAVTRAIHDRYHASRRNPWNEVECGDHYARSMASYGVFLAACGFEYHGPKEHLGFAPRLTPENFKAAFTGAEGWGAFTQKQGQRRLEAEVKAQWGKLKLRTLSLSVAKGTPVSARASLGAKEVAVKVSREGQRVLLSFIESVVIKAGEALTVRLT
jgi:non-lysosomal glucosylceramidase